LLTLFYKLKLCRSDLFSVLETDTVLVTLFEQMQWSLYEAHWARYTASA